MKKLAITSRLGIGLAALFWLGACEKRQSEAIVIGKEYIAPAIDRGSPSASPAQKLKAFSRSGVDDEITVDSYVMKQSVRGTGLDPRALKDAQYLMKVRTKTDGQTLNILTDKPHFTKIKPGETVLVKYRVGKYTGTVWAAELID